MKLVAWLQNEVLKFKFLFRGGSYGGELYAWIRNILGLVGNYVRDSTDHVSKVLVSMIFGGTKKRSLYRGSDPRDFSGGVLKGFRTSKFEGFSYRTSRIRFSKVIPIFSGKI